MAADISTTLRVIAEHAPKLRAAGVHSLTVDGVSMVLLPPDPAPMPEQQATEDTSPTSDMDDPATYGRPEGSELPGFRRPEDLPRKA